MNVFCPIGVVRTPFVDKKDAPRQPAAASEVAGTIELVSDRDLGDALIGIEEWSHLWVVYVFDRAGGYSPKVQPPRATEKKGVLATRSPHRPNPIGLSVVRLVAVRGLSLDVLGVDMLDGTPVLDLKPYVSYTDAIVDASAGWLGADPAAAWSVELTREARTQLELLKTFGVDLESRVQATLALGPEPHAYRRIKRDGDAFVLAIKDWRVRFVVLANRRISVSRLSSGYSPRELAKTKDPALSAHIALSQFIIS